MAKGLRADHQPINSADAPTFAVRKGVLRRVYHISVVWPDGRRLKLGHFQSRSDAAQWVEQKSADWLIEWHAADNKNPDAVESAAF